ncbi:hypothetical protein Ciccas_011193, partial [Cichlidogyrus casuarinus]
MTSRLVQRVSFHAWHTHVVIKQKRAGSNNRSFSASPNNYRRNVRCPSQSQYFSQHLTKKSKIRQPTWSHDDIHANNFDDMFELSNRKDSINRISKSIPPVPNEKYSNGPIVPCDYQISAISTYPSVHKKKLQSRKTCRTWKDLLYILAWLLTLYSTLILLLVAMLTLFTGHVLTVNYPHLTGMDSALRLEPGLSYVPVVDFRNNLIHFR